MEQTLKVITTDQYELSITHQHDQLFLHVRSLQQGKRSQFQLTLRHENLNEELRQIYPTLESLTECFDDQEYYAIDLGSGTIDIKTFILAKNKKMEISNIYNMTKVDKDAKCQCSKILVKLLSNQIDLLQRENQGLNQTVSALSQRVNNFERSVESEIKTVMKSIEEEILMKIDEQFSVMMLKTEEMIEESKDKTKDEEKEDNNALNQEKVKTPTQSNNEQKNTHQKVTEKENKLLMTPKKAKTNELSDNAKKEAVKKEEKNEKNMQEGRKIPEDTQAFENQQKRSLLVSENILFLRNPSSQKYVVNDRTLTYQNEKNGDWNQIFINQKISKQSKQFKFLIEKSSMAKVILGFSNLSENFDKKSSQHSELALSWQGKTGQLKGLVEKKIGKFKERDIVSITANSEDGGYILKINDQIFQHGKIESLCDSTQQYSPFVEMCHSGDSVTLL